MFKKPTPDPGLESVIADCEAEMISMSADSQEYKEALARYKDLQALKVANRPTGLSPDTLVLAAANLLGILIIVAYEQKNLVTTKALGFLKKLV